jgi:protein associated with RNAse G/E
MKIGERIHVRARKTDGMVYRSWQATIESVDADSIVTISPANQPVFDLVREQYFTQHILRSDTLTEPINLLLLIK